MQIILHMVLECTVRFFPIIVGFYLYKIIKNSIIMTLSHIKYMTKEMAKYYGSKKKVFSDN